MGRSRWRVAPMPIVGLFLASGLTTTALAHSVSNPPAPPGPRLTASVDGERLSLVHNTRVRIDSSVRLRVLITVPAGAVLERLILGVSPRHIARVTLNAHVLKSLGVQLLKQTRAPIRTKGAVSVTWVPHHSGQEWLLAEFRFHRSPPVGETGAMETILGKQWAA